MLNHIQGSCTGNWRLVGSGSARRIECDRCRARHEPTPETRLQAIDENYAGIYLRRLTAEGVAQRDQG
jgi:hypothetical protein